MRETLNRIATYAEACGENVMVIIDQINEKTRSARLPVMYSHILGRAAEHQEMRRIIEPPMHVDSVLSANIQFADWVAACVSRALDYQLIEDSPHGWITANRTVDAVRGAFTHESKVHLWHKSVSDLHHSEIFRSACRPLFPSLVGQRLSGSADPAVFRRIKAAAERAHNRR